MINEADYLNGMIVQTLETLEPSISIVKKMKGDRPIITTIFLVIIYLSFISFGLSSSLLGVAWPLMQLDLQAPFEAAGFISMTITGGTILSSLTSGSVIKRLGTGKVTCISYLIMASSLLGFSFSPSLLWLLFLAVPLGLGAGAVDSALNNYFATHYEARHMSWLHCFWGVGATIGPIIMSQFIARENSWRSGYMTVSEIQFMLAVLLFFTLPLWNRVAKERNDNKAECNIDENARVISFSQAEVVKPLQIQGVKLSLVSFFFYCGTEATIGLWGSSFLVNIKDLPVAVAAQWVALYYAGITIGRLITGFITMKVSNTMLIRGGQITALTGTALLLLPLPTLFSLIGFIMIGLGCAPIFPCMLHETPLRFGKEYSQKLMGYQMAAAFTGSTFLPFLLGLLASHITMMVLPLFALLYITAMLISSERVNVLMKIKNAAS